MSETTEGRASGPAIPYPGGTSDEIRLQDYWRILVERRAVVLTCFLAIVGAVMVATFLQKPVYRATTTMQIERQGPDILTFKDVVNVDASYGGYQDFWQTQYKILQSRTVLRIAAERLDLPNRPEFASRRASPMSRFITWIKGIVSPPAVVPGTVSDPLDPSVTFLADGIDVEPVRNSHLVQVSFNDRDPLICADVANAIAAAFQQFNLEARYSTTAQASEFLTKEVARIQADIGQAERKLQEYGSRREILAIGDSAKDISEEALSELNAKLTEARGRLALAQARFNSIEDATPNSLPEILNSPLVTNLKQQYAEVERRHSQMAERFKPDWPPLQQLQEELDKARQRLDLESQAIVEKVKGVARADLERARAEVASLQQHVDSQKVEVQRVNRDSIEFASLKNEIETKRKVLADLVARQSQTETSDRLKDTQASNIRVVDKAEVPKRPVRPKKLLNLALGIFLGLGVGIGAAVLLDHLDSTIKTEQDIERFSGLPILGNIPFFLPLRAVREEEKAPETGAPTAGTDLASHVDPRSPFAEACKNLRTSLLLASPEHPPKLILVTSCQPGDGKSTVALNLGIVLTQLGRRVMIVDADLRKPRLHRALDLENRAGLASVLTGNAALEEVVIETLVPGLDAVTSGPIPPNPSELLDSPSLIALVERLRVDSRYDHLIFDSPPAVQVTDSVILAARMDASIIVVRSGVTERESLAAGAQRLRQARGRVVAAVLNAVPETGGYYYRYRYYRHYGEEAADAATGTAVKRRLRGKLAGRL